MSDTEPPLDRDPLLTAFGRVLRPLLHVFLRRGILLPAVYRTLKVLYVETAIRDLEADGQSVTDSRISLLTGVHRRDVRRLRAEPAETAAAARPTLLATVVGRWRAGPETVDAQGHPLPLPRAAEEGPDFDTLVTAVSRDLRPRTVVDELLRQGLVTAEADGLLHLVDDAVPGADDREQKLHYFAANIGDHMAAAAANLDTRPAPNLERAVFYNRLTPDSVAALEAMAREQGQALLVALNREARRLQAADAEDPAATRRFRFGIYFHQETEGEDGSP